MSYFLEYSAGGLGDPWERIAVGFRTFELASALLSHMTRSWPSCYNAHRIVTADGVVAVTVIPGKEAA